jgi:hypothetical protein
MGTILSLPVSHTPAFVQKRVHPNLDEGSHRKKRKVSTPTTSFTELEMVSFEDQAQLYDLAMRQYNEYVKLLEALGRRKVKTKLLQALTGGVEVTKPLRDSHLKADDLATTINLLPLSENIEAELFDSHKGVTRGNGAFKSTNGQNI